MIKNLIKEFVVGFAIKLLDNYRQLTLQLLKIEAAKCYLHGVRLVRLSAIGLMWMMLVIGFIGVGLLLFHAGLFILLPWTMETKAILGLLLGLVYIVIGGIALGSALAEKTWMTKSGAAEMLEKATNHPDKD